LPEVKDRLKQTEIETRPASVLCLCLTFEVFLGGQDDIDGRVTQ
jgi:hypothetical protein